VTASDDEKWAAWCADFDEVEREVFALFHTRWMWRMLTSLMNNGVPDRQYAVVQNYFIRTYVGTVCVAIRREADLDTRTSSLARCLHTLVDCPHFASRHRYITIANAERASVGGPSDEEIDASFDQFAPNGGDHVDPVVPRAALERLTTSAQPIRKYTNKVLAHRERNGEIQKLAPSWTEINDALDVVGAVMQQFYTLRHPSQQLRRVTPLGDLQFTSMFRVPWWTETWRPPAEA
jgi:hypothetical protein